MTLQSNLKLVEIKLLAAEMPYVLSTDLNTYDAATKMRQTCGILSAEKSDQVGPIGYASLSVVAKTYL